MPTLRTTWEAKKQLVDLLVQCGIPEECMVPQSFNFTGPDPKLDMLVALIAMGTYPNVCMHKEKRKVLTTGEFIFHVIFEMAYLPKVTDKCFHSRFTKFIANALY